MTENAIMGSLNGKTALVTGAGQGVGQGIAWALAAEGASVAVAGRTFAKLETTCAEIARRGGTAFAVECDVKRLDSLEQCVARVVERLERINILVNNAQEVPLGPLNGVTEQALQAGWESGPLATFRLMKLCYPHLKGDGLIRDHRVVKLAEVEAMKNLPRVTPAERKARVAARKGDYETRVR